MGADLHRIHFYSQLVAEGRVCSLWMLPGDVAKEPAGELIADFGDRFEADPFETEENV